MIIREKYLAKIRPFYESDLIKVITGIRRCGKSIILNQIMSEIRKRTNNIIYLNFEKTSDLLKSSNSIDLINYVTNNRKKGKCYIFLDEIQEVKDWQIAVKDLRLDNNSIFITGSNSKLLSSEILTFLSGRFIDFRIRPFVYLEIEEFMKQNGKTPSINDYLIWGGFPGRFSFDLLDSQKEYLYDLEDTIVYNDLIKRYNIKKQIVFRKIVQFILISNARIISVRNIWRYIKSECENVSLNTVLKYIKYLKEAYIVDEVPQYSKKAKKELAYYYKLYNADVSFNSLTVINNRYDLDHNLENIVYNELLYRNFIVRVYDNNGKEIDFYACKDGREYYIQVAYSLVDSKAYEREFNAFSNINNFAQKIIISTDENDYSTSTIKHISLEKFLKSEEL